MNTTICIIRHDGDEKANSFLSFILGAVSVESLQRFATTSSHIVETWLYFGTEATGNRFAGVVIAEKLLRKTTTSKRGMGGQKIENFGLTPTRALFCVRVHF